MLRSLTALLGALAFFTYAAPVAAQTVGTSPHAASFFRLFDQQTLVGQQIQAPAPNLRLESFTFYVSRSSPALGIIPAVYEVTSTAGGVTLSAPLWIGAPVPVASTTQTAYAFTIGSNLPLDPAKTYVVAVRQETAGQTGLVYSALVDDYRPGARIAGSANPYSTDFGDLGFQAVFGPAAAPAPVPTLSEWAMILFSVILAGGAALYVQRRRLMV